MGGWRGGREGGVMVLWFPCLGRLAHRKQEVAGESYGLDLQEAEKFTSGCDDKREKFLSLFCIRPTSGRHLERPGPSGPRWDQLGSDDIISAVSAVFVFLTSTCLQENCDDVDAAAV